MNTLFRKESFEILPIFPNFLRSYALSRSATREETGIYQFVTKSHASFHLWWKKNLLNYQKVSNYYQHYCVQNFLFLFMSFFTALLVKNSHVLAGTYFVFF